MLSDKLTLGTYLVVVGDSCRVFTNYLSALEFASKVSLKKDQTAVILEPSLIQSWGKTSV